MRQLEDAVREQDGDAVDEGISSGAAEAEDALRLKLQCLTADRADDPAEIFGFHGPYAHFSVLISILAISGSQGDRFDAIP